MRKIIPAGLILFFAVVCLFAEGVTYYVAQDDSESFTSIQEAIEAAGPKDTVEVTDTEVYNEQVTIDSTKKGLVLRSSNPGAPQKPTIEYQDTENLGPRTPDEADHDSLVTYDRNGAVQLIFTKNITIDGFTVSGGQPMIFSADNVWDVRVSEDEVVEDQWSLVHGNSAIALTVSGHCHIRHCNIESAYFGIMFKDRNEGGIYANANPGDNNPWNVIPLSDFAETGHHILEYCNIYDNSWGVFFESSWDLGSNIRFNKIYNNYHHNLVDPSGSSVSVSDITNLGAPPPDPDIAGEAGPEGENHPGGAFMFKDQWLSPIAIHNNTLYNNYFTMMGHDRPGTQLFWFNNIMGTPKYYLSDGYPDGTFANPWYTGLDELFPNRMINSLYSGQQQEADEYYAAIFNQVEPTPTEPGGDLPLGNDVKWLETNSTYFSNLSNPSAQDYLSPDWSNSTASNLIAEQGFTQYLDPDGNTSDIGAVTESGQELKDIVTITPLYNVEFDGNTATAQFLINVEKGQFENINIAWLCYVQEGIEEEFGPNADPVASSDIFRASQISGWQDHNWDREGYHRVNFELPEAQADLEDYGFFELILTGTGSDGNRVSSEVGYIPYRRYENRLDVSVIDEDGNLLDTVQAGDQVYLSVTPIRAGEVFTQEITDVDVDLSTDGTLMDHSGSVFELNSILEETVSEIMFTKVPDNTTEFVRISSFWRNENTGQVLPFQGISQDIVVRAGDPSNLEFKDPPSNSLNINPPVVDPGSPYTGFLQVYDMFDNPIDQVADVHLTSLDPDRGDVLTPDIQTDNTGRAEFDIESLGNDSGQIYTIEGELAANGATDEADVVVGSSGERLYIWYERIDEMPVSRDETSLIKVPVGERVKVTVWAVAPDDPSEPLESRNFDISVSSAVPGISLDFYPDQSSTTSQTTYSLDSGSVSFYVTGMSETIDDRVGDGVSVESGDIQGATRQQIVFVKGSNSVADAEAFDSDGNGRIDSVVVSYVSDLIDQDSTPRLPDTLKLWGFGDITESSALVLTSDDLEFGADNKEVIATLSTEFPKATSGVGRGVSVHTFNETVGPEALPEFPIEERVGPILFGAQYVKDYSPGDDTMIVDLSESIWSLNGSSTPPAFYLIRSDGVEELSAVASIVEDEGNAIYRFVIPEGHPGISAGDSLRIYSSGGEGQIKDNANQILAHEDNPAVEISIIEAAVPIDDAGYYDTNGDGRVDQVKAILRRSVTGSDINSVSFDFHDQTLTTESAGVEVDGKDLTIAVNGAPQNVTSGDMTMTLNYTQDAFSTGSVTSPVEDRAAPVLISGEFSPGDWVKGDTIRYDDRLSLELSEPAELSSGSGDPFYFKDSEGNRYTGELNQTGGNGSKTFTFDVSELEGRTYPSEGDSVFIDGGNGLVSDLIGNIQENDPGVEMNVKPVPPNLMTKRVNIIGSKNGEVVDTIPQKFFQGEGRQPSFRYGLFYEFDPGTKDFEEAGRIRITGAVIYDVVGNKIAEMKEGDRQNGVLEAVFYDEDKSFVVFWSGKNQEGRTIGPGAYLGIIDFRFENISKAQLNNMNVENPAIWRIQVKAGEVDEF